MVLNEGQGFVTNLVSSPSALLWQELAKLSSAKLPHVSSAELVYNTNQVASPTYAKLEQAAQPPSDKNVRLQPAPTLMKCS